MLDAIRPSCSPIGRRRRRAFTFVEILATMALLAIVLPAVMGGISLCLSTASLARRQAEASALCQGKLMELVAEGQWQHAEAGGDFGPEWPDYRWTAKVTDWDGELVRQLDVTVLWRHRYAERGVTLSTLVYTGGTQ